MRILYLEQRRHRNQRGGASQASRLKSAAKINDEKARDGGGPPKEGSAAGGSALASSSREARLPAGLHSRAAVMRSMVGLCCAIAACGAIGTTLAQDAAPAVCSSSSECTACHACCFPMDAATCEACVESECPAPAPTPAPALHRCLSGTDGSCNVCDSCCKPFLADHEDCDACVEEECSSSGAGAAIEPAPEPSAVRVQPSRLADVPAFDCADPVEMPATCSTEPNAEPNSAIRRACLEQCWAPWAPCLRRPAPLGPCLSAVHVLLLVAVLVPYCGRVFGDYVLSCVCSRSRRDRPSGGRDPYAYGARMDEYGVLDGTLDGMPEELDDMPIDPFNRMVTVSRKEERKATVRAGVPYEYSAVVQGQKDCIMGVHFEGSAQGSHRQVLALEIEKADKRKTKLTGFYTPEESGELVFEFDNTFSWFTDKSIKLVVKAKGRPPQPDRRVHMSYVCSLGSSWNEACTWLGLTPPVALLCTLGRLVFWHVLQPLAYFGAFWTVSYQLDSLQYLLGALVALRELIYLVATFAALVKNPTFLLLDVRACYTDRSATGDDSATQIMNGGPSFLLMYTCMPEKVVERALFSSGGVGTDVANLPKLVGVIFDLVGCAALVYGMSKGALPFPLAVGYSMTSLGGLVMLYEIATSTGGSRGGGGGRLSRSSSSGGAGHGGMGGIGGGPPYSTGYGGDEGELYRMDSTVSPHGSPRSPPGGGSPGSGSGGLMEPVNVYSKSSGIWCDGHVVTVRSLQSCELCLATRSPQHLLAIEASVHRTGIMYLPASLPESTPQSQ